ncbi:MAG: host attachment protein [Chlamydiales bacterium]|nr:host attachment protein [Chlamydiia bacterium]MCP5508361.1 host attachment protein [Chlamydiales bacterium]
MYTDTWIVVADGAKARLFKAHSNNHLIEEETLVHPETREKASEIVSDRQGRTFDRFGGGRHGAGSDEEIKDEELKKFARDISGKLGELYNSNQLKQLIIAAPPRFLGVLKDSLDHNLHKILYHTVNKDLTTLSVEEIRGYLPSVL